VNEETKPIRRVPVQGLVLVAVVFVAGLLTGGAIERIRMSHVRPLPPSMENRGPLPWPFASLDLTEEQESRIIEIFESGRPLTDSIMQEVMPRLTAINDSIREEIRSILTPEQVEQLEREFEKRGLPPEDFGRHWRPGPPPPR
jgi:Spy/CpxP family protein refolding chaperone